MGSLDDFPLKNIKFTFTLTLTISTCIVMTYQIGYSMVISKVITDKIRHMVLTILNYISLELLPIVAGQMMRNQGLYFYRTLTGLYNTMIIDPNENKVKLVKDFVRMTKKNPLEIKLLPKLPLGMYMVPIILALGINYAIIVLQFNHII